MLDVEKNQLLTQVGPGTPMGELLRRYWHADRRASANSTTTPIKPIRLLGRRPRALQGPGRHVTAWSTGIAPHRRADMSYGFVEECGLRCNYHGWLFDEKARCIEQPYEDVARTAGALQRQGSSIKAYPVRGAGRAALGVPGSAAGAAGAELGAVHLEERLRPDRVRRSSLQLAAVPGELDRPDALRVDAPQLERAPARAKPAPYSPRHLQARLRGVRLRLRLPPHRAKAPTRTIRCGPIGRVCLWPNALFTGEHFEWRVPIDDENTSQRHLVLHRVPKRASPTSSNRIPAWEGPDRPRNRPLDHEPHHEPGFRRVGRPGHHRRPRA